MPDRAISFSAPMVNALLAGQKTCTRRLLWRTRKNAKNAPKVPMDIGLDYPPPITVDPKVSFGLGTWHTAQPGERLWVRERLQWNRDTDDRFFYAADGKDVPRETIPDGYKITNPSSPSIFMPRWASRLTLRLTSVRIEALREISRQDAVAEGVLTLDGAGTTPTQRFLDLWSELHDKDYERVDDNPWVVVLHFTCQKGNIDEVR